MAHLKTRFVLIPIFLNLVLLAGIPYYHTFSTSSMFHSLFSLVALAMIFPWVMFFVVGAFFDFIARNSAKKRDEVENSDFV